MGLLKYLRGIMPSKIRCPEVVEKPEVKKRRRAATIKGRPTDAKSPDEEKLEEYLANYTDTKEYGGDGGELTGKTIKTLAMIMFKAGDDSKTIISGLPKYSEKEPEYAECRRNSDGSEYAVVVPRDPTPDELKKAAEGLIEGINKLLEAKVGPFYINAIVEELRELELTEAVLNEVVSLIDEGNEDLKAIVIKAASDAAGGGKRARRVRRTKRTKGKSRGRAGKATRVRRNNNNNSNNNAKTKRNKGKKRRTKRA